MFLPSHSVLFLFLQGMKLSIFKFESPGPEEVTLACGAGGWENQDQVATPGTAPMCINLGGKQKGKRVCTKEKQLRKGGEVPVSLAGNPLVEGMNPFSPGLPQPLEKDINSLMRAVTSDLVTFQGPTSKHCSFGNQVSARVLEETSHT